MAYTASHLDFPQISMHSYMGNLKTMVLTNCEDNGRLGQKMYEI